ncbi:MAG: uroporphyrinogen decarboxylase [Niabella sp.]
MTNYVEWVGYVAMALLVLSFIPKKLRLIRFINFFGCLFFVTYGILLGWKWPIIISNGLIAVIQVYYLVIRDRQTAEV